MAVAIRGPADVPVSEITFGDPLTVQGGASYFCRASHNTGSGVRLQLPECSTKAGIVTTSRGSYLDLMYSADSAQGVFAWFEELEQRVRDHVAENSKTWFTEEIPLDEIEEMMLPLMRISSGGRKAVLRASTGGRGGAAAFVLYGEDATQKPLDSIQAGTALIPLVEITGIRVSARNISVDVHVIQAMVVKPPDPIERCLITRPTQGDLSPQASSTRLSNEDSRGGFEERRDEPEKGTEISESAPDSRDNDPLSLITDNVDSTNSDSMLLPPPNTKNETDTAPTSAESAIGSTGENDESSRNSSPEPQSEFVMPTPAVLPPVEGQMVIQDREEIMWERYRAARIRAKELSRAAIRARLEARGIKNDFNLDWPESSDSDHDEVATGL